MQATPHSAPPVGALVSALMLAGCLVLAPAAHSAQSRTILLAQQSAQENAAPASPQEMGPEADAEEDNETSGANDDAEDKAQEADGDSEDATAETGNPADDGEATELPTVYRDLSELPFPARKMHELISEAAAAGDIEKLRPYIGIGESQTMLSFGGRPDDPIEFLKSLSGDDDGYEILAILKEVLEAGFVKLEEGTENELYVWPYFYGLPLDALTPPQRVEMYRLLTHGDYQDMKMLGAYVFYRLGITPQGRWQFFVNGD